MGVVKLRERLGRYRISPIHKTKVCKHVAKTQNLCGYLLANNTSSVGL